MSLEQAFERFAFSGSGGAQRGRDQVNDLRLQHKKKERKKKERKKKKKKKTLVDVLSDSAYEHMSSSEDERERKNTTRSGGIARPKKVDSDEGFHLDEEELHSYPTFSVDQEDWRDGEVNWLPDFLIGRGIYHYQRIIINGIDYRVIENRVDSVYPTVDNPHGKVMSAVPILRGG